MDTPKGKGLSIWIPLSYSRYQPVFGKLKSSLIMLKRTRNTARKQIMQEPHNLIISNHIQVPNKNGQDLHQREKKS
ncbi:receptor like protein 19 [Prunus dulcis]|uniref:Receptor like protein 19 n=1 Tax=Prunus dulcis TaxID=3755 RepID=A0A5H2XTE2_PRUDU|nr:receptor like protein 19 [Prunus dulcis]